ncbi:hypothetical protein ABZY81_28230 [Streptomyces sp. NPDC006514]|uniref:hypothetical protein n=1 Tax=Streptomyces sp. NPDC006514 TaxID=3154308 RepID=UPI0033BC82C9
MPRLLLACLGLLGRVYGPLAKALPEQARRDLERDGLTVGVVRTQRPQGRTYLDDVAAFRTTPPDLAGVPVTVISGGLPGGGASRSTRRLVNEAHARSAATASPGKHVTAARSGHYVPFTEPDLITEEIRLLAAPPAPPS